MHLVRVERCEGLVQCVRVLLNVRRDPDALQELVRTCWQKLFVQAAEQQRGIMLRLRHLFAVVFSRHLFDEVLAAALHIEQDPAVGRVDDPVHRSVSHTISRHFEISGEFGR